MFTGIVQCLGVVGDLRKQAGGLRLRIGADELARHAKPGDSICVSGVCLTVADMTPAGFEFDVIHETLDKTMLGQLRPSDRVNLEPSLRAGDRLDGHFVQGHVDGTAAVRQVIATSNEHVVWLRPQQQLLSYIIPKGSITLDGVSLTVAGLESDAFSVALIPTTLERTTLGRLQPGDTVNVESDIMVRTVVYYLQRLGQADDAHASAAPFSLVALREVVHGALQKQGVL